MWPSFPVEKIWKKLGDRFEKGEILLQLQDSVPQSNYDKAVAQLDQAFAKFEAISQLYKDNLSSLFELKETEAKARGLMAALKGDSASVETFITPEVRDEINQSLKQRNQSFSAFHFEDQIDHLILSIRRERDYGQVKGVMS